MFCLCYGGKRIVYGPTSRKMCRRIKRQGQAAPYRPGLPLMNGPRYFKYLKIVKVTNE